MLGSWASLWLELHPCKTLLAKECVWLVIVTSVVVGIVVALLYLTCGGEISTTLAFEYSISATGRP